MRGALVVLQLGRGYRVAGTVTMRGLDVATTSPPTAVQASQTKTGRNTTATRISGAAAMLAQANQRGSTPVRSATSPAASASSDEKPIPIVTTG